MSTISLMSRRSLAAALPLAAVALLSFVAAPAQAQTTIDTSAGKVNDNVFTYGIPNTSTYGQTFTVGADTYLDDFSFYLDTGNTSLTSKAYVYAWDSVNSRATGSALYTSGPFVTSTSGSTVIVTMNTGSVQLNSGQQYVAFFSLAGLESGQSGGSSWATGGSDYAGGSFVFINNGDDPSQFTNGTWTTNWLGSGDLAFTAHLSATGAAAPVPEPGMVVTGLSMAGMTGLGLIRGRRRQRKSEPTA